MSATYLLPLRTRTALTADSELAVYLADLSRAMAVVVVDGSAPDVYTATAHALDGTILHVPLSPARRCANGKAWGVLSGLDRIATDFVVIADEDVRWDTAAIDRALRLLAGHDLVVPQNHFVPLPWHAAWDTARTLLNRAVAHDWPGTLVLRRAALSADEPYDGDVLFENCELVRTVRARGGSIVVARDLFVARRPPTTAHFLDQRRRQAYDDLAEPLRMAFFLTVAPTLLLTRSRGAIAMVAASTAVAEVGRRRAGGARVFPWFTSLCAPLWVVERAVMSWAAVWARVTCRGVRYGDGRMLRAATPEGQLRARASDRAWPPPQARWRPRKSATSRQPSTAAAAR